MSSTRTHLRNSRWPACTGVATLLRPCPPALPSQARVESLFRALAGLFELFLFVYIGLSLFLMPEMFGVASYTVRRARAARLSADLSGWPGLHHHALLLECPMGSWFSCTRKSAKHSAVASLGLF